MHIIGEMLTEEQKLELTDVYYILNRKMYAIVQGEKTPTKETLVVIVLDSSKGMLELTANDFKKNEEGDFEWTESGCYISKYNIPDEILAILDNNVTVKE